MKVKETSSWSNHREMELTSAIDGHTTPDTYSGGGVAEDAREKANKTSDLLAKLIEMLHEKGVINDVNVESLLDGNYEVVG